MTSRLDIPHGYSEKTNPRETALVDDGLIGIGQIEREPHDKLYNSITELDQVINSLSQLKDKIIGNDRPAEPPIERPTPSLNYVITRGSLEVDQRIEILHELIAEIHLLLFTEQDMSPDGGSTG